jgi:hypothetical protein
MILTSTTRIAFSLLLILSLTAISFADTIRLKDGSIIKGRIISFASGKFIIAIGEGSRLKQLTYLASEIESITFDAPSDKPVLTAPNRKSNNNANIVNVSTTDPPRVVVTDNTNRTNSTDTTTPVNKPDQPVIARGNGKIQPITWTVKVLADNTSNGWTNSGWVLKKGQKIRITGEGKVSLGKGNTCTSAGLSDLQDDQKLLKNVPTGALIAVIGDDNNDFIYVGEEREFTATRDGALFLGINEGNLDDNSGSFNVKVEILPDSGN